MNLRANMQELYETKRKKKEKKIGITNAQCFPPIFTRQYLLNVREGRLGPGPVGGIQSPRPR